MKIDVFLFDKIFEYNVEENCNGKLSNVFVVVIVWLFLFIKVEILVGFSFCVVVSVEGFFGGLFCEKIIFIWFFKIVLFIKRLWNFDIRMYILFVVFNVIFIFGLSWNEIKCFL